MNRTGALHAFTKITAADVPRMPPMEKTVGSRAAEWCDNPRLRALVTSCDRADRLAVFIQMMEVRHSTTARSQNRETSHKVTPLILIMDTLLVFLLSGVMSGSKSSCVSVSLTWFLSLMGL